MLTKLYELPYKPIRNTLIFALCLLISHAAGSVAACELPTTLTHTVTEVLDSRTLKLDDGTELRLASVLTPTSFDSATTPENWPAETAAIQFLTHQTLHRNIAISLSQPPRDRYARRVGHAMLLPPRSEPSASTSQNTWLQALLVESGHARVAVATATDSTCARQLLRLEAQAEAAERGLWSQSVYQPKRAEDVFTLNRFRSTFQIVEGVVHRVAVLRNTAYLNFSPDRKRNFSVRLSLRMLKQSGLTSGWLRTLMKSPVRIRGWLEKRNGPMIMVWRMDQIELLAVAPSGSLQRFTPPRLPPEMPKTRP